MTWTRSMTEAFDQLSIDENFFNGEDILENLTRKLTVYVEIAKEDDESKLRWECLQNFGITCLEVFLMENWTGPCIKKNDIPNELKPVFEENLNQLAFEDLQHKEEGIHGLCRNVFLFWIAFKILVEISSIVSYKYSPIWSLRCLATYQDIVEEKCQSIHDKFLVFLENVQENIPELDSEIQVQFHLGCAHLHLKYYGYNNATAHLEKAREILGIEVSLTGAPGKRTRFQEKELAQLRLKLKVSDERSPVNPDRNTTTAANVPKDLVLEDETLLPSIKYSDEDSTPWLNPIEQAYILALCAVLQKTRPKDNILTEELQAYIQTVIKDPQAWAVQSKALFLRTLLECQKSRTVERSMMQMESLVEEYQSSATQANERLYLLHAVDVPPIWTYKANLARILVSLGCLKAALDIFEAIHAWDDLIVCYQKLGRLEKAEHIIRSELQKKETSKLWCLLGDVTKDTEYYEKAWEFSKHRSARAQRSLGYTLLRSGKLQECIPHFSKSLEVSPLQPQVWFSLGCAAMATNQFDIAQNSFQQSVTIEPDNHEAWNNLANAFVRTKQKHKAFKALKEALKADYRSWQIWENFLLVSVDIGQFKETIRCLHNLLDLKRKEIDTEVLRILVGAVTSDIKDANGEPAASLTGKLKELFGRITSEITNNANVWALYGDLSSAGDSADDRQKVLSFYLKANRCIVQNATWEKDPSKIAAVIEISNKLINATFKTVKHEKGEARDVQIISSTKMAVGNFLKRYAIVYPDNTLQETNDKLKDQLKDLKEKYDRLCSLLA